MTPKEEISNLIQLGNSLINQAQQEFTQGIHSDGASIIGEIFTKEFVACGYRGMARKLGHTIQKGSKTNLARIWHEQSLRYLAGCEFKIEQMSLNSKNLRPAGNSYALTRKFNRVRRLKNPIIILNSTKTVLEELQNLDLIWNKDIQNELASRKKDERKIREEVKLNHPSSSISEKATTVDLFDRSYILSQFDMYSSTRESIAGALDRLESNSPDSSRQCISSCRVAIESLCIHLGKDNDWKNALSKIFPSETDRKQVKLVWNYLSNKGAHGGHNPTKAEAQYSLQITIATLSFIITRKLS